MYIEVKRITAAEVGRLKIPHNELPAVVTCVSMSDPALAFWWKNELLALVGFIPSSIISDTVYCWVQDTEAARNHKVIFARQAILVVREIRKKFPRIIGHCKVESSKWLASFGAKFGSTVGDLIPFVIED